VRLGLVQLMQRFHYDIDWNLMVPSTSTSSSAEGQEGDVSSKKTLKVVNNFTLCPAGGIWVKLQPREVPAGVKLL
jgi:hypothetical protein